MWRARIDVVGLALDVDVVQTATTLKSKYIEYPRIIDLRQWASANL